MKNTSRKLFFVVLLLSAALRVSAADAAKEAKEVRRIIERVNDYWQSRNPPETRAFWDHAAYHTGNMEAYLLTRNERYREYAEAWARHNQWQGAKGTDRSRWRYDYGEDDDHVLFGDWQICFQTYADLYMLHPEQYKIERAREVMEYEMSTAANDYWWWADGLYMVMPVMTKLYRITADDRYLEKLFQYVSHSDSIMLDPETGLYFRDAKYVFPRHQTACGRKDFWARGDGWVLAGLAKVLKDLPRNHRHRAFFEQKFLRMARSVAALQQPEGYWTRSMMDAAQAPGPETSGTAFFCYGLMWGVNSGLLPAADFLPVVRRAWRYLSTVALQPDGRVGFVQPIGEKAIPGQVVDANSEANFGVGAFLLAACEYVRFLEAPLAKDRAYWASRLYDLAAPVLSNLARGTLRQNMRLELSPSWDGRDERVAYLECFGRLMAGVAPWLSLPDDDTPEGHQRRQLRLWALQACRNAVDPDSPDCMLWQGHGQVLVDAAFLAQGFLRAYDQLWAPLDEPTKQRYIDAFRQLRAVNPPYTNWLLFSAIIESLLAKAGAGGDEYRVTSAVRKVEEWYVGDGWYSDGSDFAFDYYGSYVFHPMLLETLQAMIDARAQAMAYQRHLSRALRRAQKMAVVLERFISPEGTFPVFGRSIPYRLAAMQPLALLAWRGQLPEGLSCGLVRAALTAVIHRMFDGQANLRDGFLTIGFCGSQPEAADWYTNNGSLYLTSSVFLPLGLPASHPFWIDAPADWTSRKAWGGKPFPKDHRWAE